MIEKIIEVKTADNKFEYSPIGQSNNVSRTLGLLGVFLNNYEVEMKDGVDNFQYKTLSINDFHVEYGDPEWEDDFYVSFIDDMFDKECEDENGWVDADCLPRLKFSYENFEHIFQIWPRLQLLKPKYLITVKHESGWIDIWGREGLSEEEKQIVEEDEIFKWNRKRLREEGIEIF